MLPDGGHPGKREERLRIALAGLGGYAEDVAREGPMKPKRPRILASVEKAAPADRSEPSGRTFPWWTHLAVVLGLLLANLALYHGTVGLGFLSVDDPDYVQNT